jgi:hypothetical protein
MESWRKVWRDGLVPQMSTSHLRALQRGLARDDARLVQGATSAPPPVEHVLDWPIEGACVVGYGAWQSGAVATVGELDGWFAESCLETDRRLGEPAAVRYFLNWYDDVPRDEMRRELLAEIQHELAQRDRSAPPRRRRAAFAAA